MFLSPDILLPALIGIPLVGAFAVLLLPMRESTLRLTAVFVTLITAWFGIELFVGFRAGVEGFQMEWTRHWFSLPGLGLEPIAMRLGVDGLSVLLAVLTALLMPLVLIAAPGHIKTRIREFLFWSLLMEAGMLGVFLALDLVFFYVFWELSLVPLYFMIGIWGGARRFYATVKFFLYTVAGSMLMLVALVRVALHTGTTDLHPLLTGDLPVELQTFGFLCFALAFAIKVPLVPFHTWLPDAHVEAPTGGSVLLAGVLLKMGTYGLLRFGIQLFPATVPTWAPVFMVLGAVGIVYGAFLAWAQSDLKKLVAYSSISHLGYVVLGSFALNTIALQGSILQMINHGLSTGALFFLVGIIYDRRHTREMAHFGGLARTFPAFAFLLVFATLSSVGLPGLNGFVGEFLILLGTFEASPILAIVGGTGVILGAIYMLGMCRKVLFGPVVHEENRGLAPIKPREWAALAPMMAAMLWIGLYPAPVLSRTEKACEAIVARVAPFMAAEHELDPADGPAPAEEAH